MSQEPSRATESDGPALPVAAIKPERKLSAAWVLPILALVFAAALAWRAWSIRGVAITVQLADGHGLKPGDDVRYRGISVGRVDAVTLMPDLQHVLVSAHLTTQPDLLARAGSRFWVVRPHVELTRIQGLETLVGPRFLAVLPADEGDPAASGAARMQRDFVGLADPPVVETILPGDLEIILESPQRGSMHAGAPVLYRQMRVGTLLSVGLSGDGATIEARAHIEQPYAALIRPSTKFWDSGGLKAKVGLTGVTLDIDSAEALLTGGVSLATPPVGNDAAETVHTGRRFALAEKAEKEWLEWKPMAAIGSSLLPAGASMPQPMRATIGWRQGRWIKGTKSHQGWVLQTESGVLGPGDLLKPGEKADRDSAALEVEGKVLPLQVAPLWERNGLALLKGSIAPNAWPESSMRTPTQIEECLVIADPAANALPIAASRLTPSADGAKWIIDPAVSIDPSWHGAAVVARSDGALIGILLAEDDHEARQVALLPGAADHKP